MRRTLGWLLLLAVVVALFFWKILFTNQYSMLLSWEPVNQAYAWYTYAARTIQQGILPAWDPYTLAGHTFVGETQTGLFYPLKLLLYLWPLNHSGLLSERLFHQVYVLAHLLGGIFMYLCAREVGVKDAFSAFVSAVCFTLGGFVGKMGWVHLMDSMIWLPLVFFFLLRSLRAARPKRRYAYACASGLALGMAVLAGSIHAPFMDVFVILSAALLFARPASGENVPGGSWRSGLLASAIVVLIVGVVSFAAGSVQLLPSMEYAPLATRWTTVWSGPFRQKIPYYVTGGFVRLTPRSLFAFLFGSAETGGGEYGPYFGVMPLLLAVIGVWRNWSNPWVKYLTGLAVAAFLVCLGNYSLLHGLLYVFVPYADKLWEAGRYIYLTHFAMALLAGFGVQTLLAAEPASASCFRRLNRILGGIVVTVAIAVGIPTLWKEPVLADWSYLTLIILLATWALFHYIRSGHRSGVAQFLLIALILCDLYSFDWSFQNRMDVQKAGEDHMEEMHSLRPVADFLKAQPGRFRSNPDPDFSPRNMGDVFAFETTSGYGATMLTDYLPALFSPMGRCLFNVRYNLGTGSYRKTETPVFASGPWKVYEQPDSCPRAWVVQRAAVDSPANVQKLVEQGAFDPRQIAYLNEPLTPQLDASAAAPASITFGNHQPDEFSLDADLSATGLLVLSEVYYPGWIATVNGQPAHIYKVDSILRGLVLSPGRSHIVMRYRPMSIYVGAGLSSLAFLFTFAFAAFAFRTPDSNTAP